MARIEVREFKDKSFLLLISEKEEDSDLIEKIAPKLGDKLLGETKLADGYGEHYVSLEKIELTPEEKEVFLRCDKLVRNAQDIPFADGIKLLDIIERFAGKLT